MLVAERGLCDSHRDGCCGAAGTGVGGSEGNASSVAGASGRGSADPRGAAGHSLLHLQQEQGQGCQQEPSCHRVAVPKHVLPLLRHFLFFFFFSDFSVCSTSPSQ